jgi:hypothetical protein
MLSYRLADYALALPQVLKHSLLLSAKTVALVDFAMSAASKILFLPLLEVDRVLRASSVASRLWILPLRVVDQVWR